MNKILIFLIISYIEYCIGQCQLPTWRGRCNNANREAKEMEKQSRPTFTSRENPRWTEEFGMKNLLNGWRWTTNRTSAFVCQNHNPGNNNLDYLQSNDWHLEENNGLTIKAAKSQPEIWLENGKLAYNTGLLTTEYSVEEFMVKTDNYIETYVQLPNKLGAWPALFTWKTTGMWGVNNEVDMFEYHLDHPHTLELTSHLYGEPACRYENDWIKPGGWVNIGTNLGKDSITWYVNDKVACTKRGVGPDYRAHIILALLVCEGVCQENGWPKGPNEDLLWFRAQYVRVFENMSYKN